MLDVDHTKDLRKYTQTVDGKPLPASSSISALPSKEGIAPSSRAPIAANAIGYASISSRKSSALQCPMPSWMRRSSKSANGWQRTGISTASLFTICSRRSTGSSQRF